MFLQVHRHGEWGLSLLSGSGLPAGEWCVHPGLRTDLQHRGTMADSLKTSPPCLLSTSLDTPHSWVLHRYTHSCSCVYDPWCKWFSKNLRGNKKGKVTHSFLAQKNKYLTILICIHVVARLADRFTWLKCSWKTLCSMGTTGLGEWYTKA